MKADQDKWSTTSGGRSGSPMLSTSVSCTKISSTRNSFHSEF